MIAVIAQSVDGKWSGEVQGGRGPQQVNMTLKADGGKLTGSVMGRGGETPIQEGTIAGTALKFKTQQQGRGGYRPDRCIERLFRDAEFWPRCHPIRGQHIGRDHLYQRDL